MNVLDHDIKFRYQLLDRMRQDVGYCIRLIRNDKEENRKGDYTFLLNNHLWGGQEDHFNRIRQKSPILYRWVMNAVRYEGYRW
ncbi:hypothetical protein ACNG34_002681 [Enterococcus faecium]